MNEASISDAVLSHNGNLFGQRFADGVLCGLSERGLNTGDDDRVIAALVQALTEKLTAMLAAGTPPSLAEAFARAAEAGFAQRCLEWRAAAEAGTVLLDSD